VESQLGCGTTVRLLVEESRDAGSDL